RAACAPSTPEVFYALLLQRGRGVRPLPHSAWQNILVEGVPHGPPPDKRLSSLQGDAEWGRKIIGYRPPATKDIL
ncbi:MAG: hypothetical protein V3T23_07860, partial [Nitrososphaerales archaeon]